VVDGVTGYEKGSKVSFEDFKQLFGVKEETFDAMITVLKAVYTAKMQ
jgi:hypothetical protein